MDETPWYVTLFVSWLPFILIMSVWLWIARIVSRALRTPDGRSLGQVVDEHGSQLKRSNDHLERLLNECCHRLDALEKQT
jgi:hypothetical protein